MKLLKNLALYLLSGFFALVALVYMPSLSSLFALLALVLIIPIAKWQAFFNNYISRKLKTILAVVLTVLIIGCAPTSNSSENNIVDEDRTPVTDTANVGNRPGFGSSNKTPANDKITNANDEGNKADDVSVGENNDNTHSNAGGKDAAGENNFTEESTLPVHEHTFVTATCTEPQQCSACGETIGAATGHSWQDATCTSPKTCITCGTTEGTSDNHAWSAATCFAPQTCAVCGITEGSTSEHSWQDATYTSPKTCAVCGVTEGTPNEVPGKENYHGYVYTGGDSNVKYHYESNCAGKYSHEITWDEVEQRNLGPCGTCVLK